MFSVVICTYQRPKILPRSLGGLTEQTIPDDEFEVLVVFDDSDTETAGVVQEYTARLPTVRMLDDDGRGLSHARNVGYEAAAGEYVVFLDDDGSPNPDWLATYREVFGEVTPTPDCVGGPVRPEFEESKPWWFPPGNPGLPVWEPNSEPRWVEYPDEAVIGANMAYPRSFLQQTGGFPTDLGRKDGTLLSNEETIFQAQAAVGNGIYYHPDAWVDHHIEAFRLGSRYLLRRHYWQGVSDCRTSPDRVGEDGIEGKGRSFREGVPRALSVFSKLLTAGRVDAYVMTVLWVAYVVGFAHERLRRAVRRG
jgi:glycosyltransferase involved in cell wall biosynthesis